MYEYMNPGFMFITGLMLFMMFTTLLIVISDSKVKSKEFKHPFPLYFLSVVVVLMLIWDALDTQERVLTNKKLFESNSELICSVITNSYLVSKPKGWYFLDKENLTNGNIIVSIQICKEQ